MANRHRGEVEAELGGKRRQLCLTLGALAELETALGVEDLSALAERFGSGRISARDAIRVIGAGLRGAGEEISDEEAARLVSRDAAAGYVRIVVDLLSATFGVAENGTSQNPPPPQA
ncbi:MAG: gene transfer agent family protein [Xanthobacteraceae bacterium]|nr:gene transfer agent family protein [Xanthobacteraceae bacterium]